MESKLAQLDVHITTEHLICAKGKVSVSEAIDNDLLHKCKMCV